MPLPQPKPQLLTVRTANNEPNAKNAAAKIATANAVSLDRLAQVLGNLLDNALRHAPPGGEVWSLFSSTARFG